MAIAMIRNVISISCLCALEWQALCAPRPEPDIRYPQPLAEFQIGWMTLANFGPSRLPKNSP